MRRRAFTTLAISAAAFALSALWPCAAHAQKAMPVIGFLNTVAPDGFAARLRGFRQGLKEAGFVEGENVAIEYRWAENQLDRLPSLAADLVRRQVTVIVAGGGTAPAFAAKAATTTIPIVFSAPEDPVKIGLVTTLARPTGNLTGVNFFSGELVAKRLELLRQLVPSAVRLAVLVNLADAGRSKLTLGELEEPARSMGFKVQVFNGSTRAEINEAFAAMARERSDVLFIGPNPFFVIRRVQLATLAARHAIPTSASNRDLAEAGGLMSYGTDITDAYRQLGVYAGRILKGAKPTDLPVLQSTKFELVINLQTAQMLGVTVPQTLLVAADEVIE